MWSGREEVYVFSLGKILGRKVGGFVESSRRSWEKEIRRNEKFYRNFDKKIEEWSSIVERNCCWGSICCRKGNIKIFNEDIIYDYVFWGLEMLMY